MRNPGTHVALLTVVLAFASCHRATVTLNSFPPDKFFDFEGTIYEAAAKDFGWSSEFERGREILRELFELTPRSISKIKFDAYVGERVAFYVGPVPATDLTGDLGTEAGYYLRVVVREGEKIEPGGMLWDAMVRGKILQVLPKNKIIVLEIDPKDFRTILG